MAERNTVVTIPKYVDALVPGSGKYSMSELREHNRLRSQRVYDELQALNDIEMLARVAQALPTGDTAEEVAAFEAGFTVQMKRLVRDYRVLATTNDATLKDVRNADLQAIIDNFAARDANSDGKINKAESGLHAQLFTALDIDADNKLTVAELQAGIAV